MHPPLLSGRNLRPVPKTDHVLTGLEFSSVSFFFFFAIPSFLFRIQFCDLVSAMMLASMAEREQYRGIHSAKLHFFYIMNARQVPVNHRCLSTLMIVSQPFPSIFSLVLYTKVTGHELAEPRNE